MTKKRLVNPNLEFLRKCYLNGKRGVLLEGGSRSGKTWSCLDFIVWLCATVETDATILIVRKTYHSFKTSIYEDLNRRLPMYGLASPVFGRHEVPSFWLFGNKITFIGADDVNTLQGVGSDYVYFNEGLDIKRETFHFIEQRCRKFWVMDYNPRYLHHWVYNEIVNRPDIGILKTTFKDNPFISVAEKSKLLSYDPSNPDNVKAGTANSYLWAVMGLGERAAPEGIIFPNVEWIDQFPEKAFKKVMFGLDFGYTNSPSCLVRCAVLENELFAESLFYKPTPTVDELIEVLKSNVGQAICWADPSGEYGNRAFISDIRRAGVRVYAANTYPGSIQYSISLLKRFRLKIVKDKNVLSEQLGYRYRVVNGIMTDEPMDEFNHFWDALRMVVLGNRDVFLKKIIY